MVDLVAHDNIGSNIQLTKTESLKRIVLDGAAEKLKLPMIIPVESLEGVTE